MNLTEQGAFRELQQYASKLAVKGELSGWSVKSCRQGAYYQHEGSCLTFQTLEATKIAVQALSQIDRSYITETANVTQEDDEDEEGDELLNLCSSLDGVIGQLQKQMKTLQ